MKKLTQANETYNNIKVNDIVKIHNGINLRAVIQKENTLYDLEKAPHISTDDYYHTDIKDIPLKESLAIVLKTELRLYHTSNNKNTYYIQDILIQIGKGLYLIFSGDVTKYKILE